MSEFDDLLRDVLRDDVIAEPPAGMEARLRSFLSAERGMRATGGTIWPAAVAAVMLIGVVGGLVFKHVSTAASVRPASDRGSLVTQHAPEKVPTAADSGAHVRAVSGRIGASVARHRVPPAWIELEPLRIQPIEIAPLKVRSLALEGETR
jgi:hypothetical protein